MEIIQYKDAREKELAKKDTLKKELRVLKGVLRLSNPDFKMPTALDTDEMRLTHKGKKVELCLTEENIDRALESIPSKYRNLVLVMKYSGLRLSDACYLKVGEIDFRNGFICKIQGKTGNLVRIPIMDNLRAVLESLPALASLGDGNGSCVKPDALVFPDLKSEAASTAIRRGFAEAGLKGESAKSLCHFCGSAIYKSRKDIVATSKWLGHRDIKTTQIYVHADDEMLKESGAVFNEPSPKRHQKGN